MVRDIEEIGGAEMVVALLRAGLTLDIAIVDIDRGVRGILADVHDPGHCREPAAHLGQHEVATDERHLGVPRVDRPWTGGGNFGPLTMRVVGCASSVDMTISLCGGRLAR